jgi:hypothetical protein
MSKDSVRVIIEEGVQNAFRTHSKTLDVLDPAQPTAVRECDVTCYTLHIHLQR